MMKDSVLRSLEDESIEIFRETAAAFRKLVMLSSIGKDPSVLLHLARKAFTPAPIPFPLMHIDTTWKFRKTTSFRDETAIEMGFELLEQTNTRGISEGDMPVYLGASEYNRIMKTLALREGLDKHGFDAAEGGSRRDEERRPERNANSPLVKPVIDGIQETKGRNCGENIAQGSHGIRR